MATIKTTKYDRNVLEEKEVRNFAFHSDHENLGIAKILHYTTGTSVYHGLGYCPFFIVLEARAAGGYGQINPNDIYGSVSWSVDKNFVYTNTGVSDAYIILFKNKLS